ncbi:hypothetical protein AAFF_G00024220 [Aldrovandia affinis]|uniref:Uncharacterized protein n=1 Tax=Aldrovandia affinis TaxID=143900 RepID=A0AAD7X0H1_9TELE|nr:hypothetical protein AAFF_G00024220 [Aldrovandia affinis]
MAPGPFHKEGHLEPVGCSCHSTSHMDGSTLPCMWYLGNTPENSAAETQVQAAYSSTLPCAEPRRCRQSQVLLLSADTLLVFLLSRGALQWVTLQREKWTVL